MTHTAVLFFDGTLTRDELRTRANATAIRTHGDRFRWLTADLLPADEHSPAEWRVSLEWWA